MKHLSHTTTPHHMNPVQNEQADFATSLNHYAFKQLQRVARSENEFENHEQLDFGPGSEAEIYKKAHSEFTLAHRR